MFLCVYECVCVLFLHIYDGFYSVYFCICVMTRETVRKCVHKQVRATEKLEKQFEARSSIVILILTYWLSLLRRETDRQAERGNSQTDREGGGGVMERERETRAEWMLEGWQCWLTKRKLNWERKSSIFPWNEWKPPDNVTGYTNASRNAQQVDETCSGGAGSEVYGTISNKHSETLALPTVLPPNYLGWTTNARCTWYDIHC